MSNLIKVDTKDKLRVLLTDVLPYELPLWFTNYQMYHALKEKLTTYAAVSGLKNPLETKRYIRTIPLDYKVFRGERKSARLLSIMHPFSQLAVCDFYNDNDSLIEYYCSRSKKSLRYPHKISTKFYGKFEKGNKKSSVGIEMEYDDPITSSSYFKYLKYPFLYRFFESYEYHKLEKKFSGLLQVDIAKCFPSIYTHTIGWATKGKLVAKQQSRGTFDDSFDSLMQNMNFGETNGIIIGPEVSRIFSEVILQQVDIDIISELEIKNLSLGKDYDFRRYVDDYFVFYRDRKVSEQVSEAISNCLVKYKMYLNESKTEYRARPFSTAISIAKMRIKEVIEGVFHGRESNCTLLPSNTRPDITANRIISKIKMEVSTHNVNYQSISNYLLKSIENKNNQLILAINGQSSITQDALNWILVDLDVLFFIHAMDIRIRTTDKISRQVYLIVKSCRKLDQTSKELIFKKIFDLLKQAIDIFIDTKEEIFGLETLNLLVTLSLLTDKYKLDHARLKAYYEAIRSNETDDSFYFKWVTFMLYIGNDSQYQDLHKDIIESGKNFILNNQSGFYCTQLFLIFFDFVSCPYIDQKLRCDLLTVIQEKTNSSYNDAKRDYILKHDFLVPWRDKNYLHHALSKREFIFSYE